MALEQPVINTLLHFTASCVQPFLNHGDATEPTQADEGEGVTLMGSHHFPPGLLWLPPSHPMQGEQNQDGGGGSRLCLRAGSLQAGLQADSTVWPKEPPCRCWGPLTVSFQSRDGMAIFLSDEFTAAVMVTGEDLCLERQKKINQNSTADSWNTCDEFPEQDANLQMQQFCHFYYALP